MVTVESPVTISTFMNVPVSFTSTGSSGVMVNGRRNPGLIGLVSFMCACGIGSSAPSVNTQNRAFGFG